MDRLLSHEPMLRLLPFLGVFALMAVAEALWPRRDRSQPRWRRWPSNLGIVALDTLVLRLAFPVAAVGMALVAESEGLGLLNWLGIEGVPAVILAILLLDLVIYGQHRLFHAVPLLWRLHRMHHADLDFDVTTGLRFHPAEILLSMLIKLAAVLALGAPAVAVLLFEILLNATSLFNHANLRLPPGLDRVLRGVLVTPDMHRVHHSAVPQETDSNFGFSLALWDRLFRTYRPQPAAGHAAMTIGLAQFRDEGELRLDRMLTQPLRGDEAGRAPSPP
jgi:sterol desaturase/sphingolipid hydroxylase (fatty acid hydroxylase superfamily)